MKIKHLMIMCGMAAALLSSIEMVNAQNDNGGGGGFGGGGGGFGGGGGGFGGGGGGRGGRGGGGGFGANMDPAAMQQRLLDNIQQELDFTNDTDWSAVEPLVQKVIETRQAVLQANLQRLMFGGGRGGQGGGRGGQGGGRGGRGGGNMAGLTTNPPEADALQKALDDDAPTGQIKDLLTKFQTAQKAKIAKAKEAEEALRMVLTPRQEATATLLGLLEVP